MTDPTDRAGSVLEIDLAAIVANWRLLAGMAAPAQCAAVVKADAYGLGAARVAPALAAAGCRIFFVATLDEGTSLRAALGPGPEIAVLNGPLRGAASEFAVHGLIPVLNEPGQIETWSAFAPHPGPLPARGERESAREVDASGQGLGAILHVDTGMARLGLSRAEFDAVMETPPPVRWRAVMSHLACADASEHPLNEAQRVRFAEIRGRLLEVPASLAASSGIFLGPRYHCDLVRPGAALYGVNPRPGGPNPMRPVVTLRARILQLREIDRGEPVGYGAAHLMQRPSRLATAAVGYADGWLRSFSHRGCGRLAGKRVPLVGRVSMDLASFDVTEVEPHLVHPGATIELLGDAYGIDEAANDAGTIGYEILTALGRRYHRVYQPA